jgi:hypothetical protein
MGLIRGEFMRSKIVLIVLAASSTMLLAQSAPVKMGLWEKEITFKGPNGPNTIKARSCVTPATWQEMVQNSNKQQEGCTMHNVKTASGYSFDATCTIPPGGTMVIKGSTTLQDSEHIVSDSHSTITRNGQKTERDIHSTSHFVSASCGNVKPGEPETE